MASDRESEACYLNPAWDSSEHRSGLRGEMGDEEQARQPTLNSMNISRSLLQDYLSLEPEKRGTAHS